MDIVGASLADGTLPTSKGTLYTAPAGTTVHITNITIANAHTSGITCNLYVKRSGSSSRRIIGKDFTLAIATSLEYPQTASALRLSTGDIIEGDASVISVADYTISGGLEAV